MPYPGVPSYLTSKMEKCVSEIMRDGNKDKSSAIAICHSSIMGKDRATKKAIVRKVVRKNL